MNPLWLLLLPFSFCRDAQAVPAGAVAGSVVTSREWTVRRKGDKEEEFKGDVRYHAGPSSFASDWALYKHATSVWSVRGRVTLSRRMDSGDLVTAWGDRGTYSEALKSGALEADRRVRFERRPADGGPDEADAGRAELRGTEASFTGGVHAWGPRLEAWADRADYDDLSGKLTLSGSRPVTRNFEGEWTGAIKGDRIVAWRRDRRLEADGAVRGWLELPAPRKREKSAK